MRDGREDGQARDERHERVEHADHGGGAHEVDLLAGVGAVGDHDAHAERQGVKRLAHGHEHGLERDAGEIGLEVERQALAHAAAERQRVDGDGNEDAEQHRHEHLGGFLDAVLDAAHDDRHAQHEKQRRVENDLTRVDGERADDARVAAEGVERVLRRPAAEHGVVADDERGDHDRHEAAPAEVFVDHLVGGHGVCLRAAAEIDLAEHRDKADEQHARDVDEHEGGAAVLRRLVREAPEVAEAHGAAGGGEDEADTAGKSNFFLFHDRFPFRPFRFLYKKIGPDQNGRGRLLVYQVLSCYPANTGLARPVGGVMPRMPSIAKIDTASTVSMVSRRTLLLLVFASEHAKPAAHVVAVLSFLRLKNELRMACSSSRMDVAVIVRAGAAVVNGGMILHF